MMFDWNIFPMWIFAVVGVAVSWCKLRANQRTIYGLSAVVELFFSDNRTRNVIELLIFVVIGCLVSLGITKPTNEAQALAAGLAWTGMLSGK